MSIPIISPSRFFAGLDREQSNALQAYLDDPGTHYLVLFSGDEGSPAIAVLPVGPNCMFSSLSLVIGKRIEGMRAVSATRTRFAPTLETRFLSELWLWLGQSRLDDAAFRNFSTELREVSVEDRESLLLEVLARLRLLHNDLVHMMAQPLNEIEHARSSDGVGMPTGLRMLLIERFQEAREQLELAKRREQFLRDREATMENESASDFLDPTHPLRVPAGRT